MELSAQAFGSPELMQSLNQLDDNLRALRPGEDWGGSRGVRWASRVSASATAPACCRTSPTSTTSPSSSRSPTAAPGWTTSTSTSSSASSATQAGVDARTPGRARAGAARLRLPQARLRRRPPALAQGDAPARQGAARATSPHRMSGRQGAARPAPGRCGRRAVRVRAASGPSATPSRGTSRARSPTPSYARWARAATPATACGSTCATSRSTRPRPAPRPRSRCSSTRRSRWRWPTAGCR